MNPESGTRRRSTVLRLVRSPADAWLVVRMTLWALAVSLLKHPVALPTLARWMWRDGRGDPTDAEIDRVVRLSTLAARARRPPGRDNCLERSLIAYRYLSRLNADPRLVMAMRKDDQLLAGHAWVTVDGDVVGREDVAAFTPVLELGSHGRRINTG